MTDEAIPFEREFKPLTDKQRTSVTEAIKNIRQADKDLDKILPMIVESVTAGDNVSIANQLLRALRGRRKDPVKLFLQAYLPHQYRENGTFGKRLDKRKARRKETAYREWLKKGETFSEWSTREVKPAERKTKTISEKLHDDFLKAIESGLTPQQIIDMLNKVVAEKSASDNSASAKAAQLEAQAEPKAVAVAA